MQKNDLVKFSEILEPGDENLVMRVLEVNGDRVLVETLLPGWSILPTNVFKISDLTEMTK